jgi:hypothetical protein
LKTTTSFIVLLPRIGNEHDIQVSATIAKSREENRASGQKKNRAYERKPYEITCLMAKAGNKKGITIHDEMVFDGQTYLMAIDTGCSFCITNDDRHFVGEPEIINTKVKGVGGKQVIVNKRGTVKWTYLNDEGCVHEQYIPNTYYNKESPYCLYSPQHVAQVASDNYPETNGTCVITYADSLVLMWEQKTQTRTVTVDPATNIFLMRSAPSFERFHAFNSTIDAIEDGMYEMHSPNIVSDGESDDESVVSATETEPDESRIPNMVTNQNNQPIVLNVPHRENVNDRRHPDIPDSVFDRIQFNGDMEILPTEDVEIQANTTQAQLLAWHYRLGHIPFAKIRQMASRGDLPIGLATCQIPKCAACMYGKATRRAWRTKSPVNAIANKQVTAPGAVVSMDQLVSSVPGLIGQMKGFLTRKRYTVATVFVDHFSGMSYVYLQKGATALETIEAKRAFERFASTHGVVVKHYHSDNGIFETREFRDEIAATRQTISFCGVNAHHQNGKAEKKIRDLQELSRTMILHAQQRWSTAINAYLWPFAIKMANELSNRAPGIHTGISPIEMFSQIEMSPQVKHSHTFGAPVYVLDNALQTPGIGTPKWSKRSNIGIYVGTSPRHSRKIALVLNLMTGHVSPQFHIVVDDFFETLRASAGNPVPQSDWQTMTGFIRSQKQQHTVKAINPLAPRKEHEMEHENNSEIMKDEIMTVDATDDMLGQQPTTGADMHERSENKGDSVDDNAIRTKSGRVSKPTERMRESIEQQMDGLVSLFVEWEVYHDDAYTIQTEMENPLAFAASTNPDVMYLDQAMNEPDREKFREAMVKEVQAHTENGHWKIVPKRSVPRGTKILPAVWAMRRKRKIATGEPYKWKARLNVHGGKQEHGINYWETYAPVISWTTIRLYLILAILNMKVTRQIDFVLAFPQADIECDLYMEIPKGFKFEGTRDEYCLLLVANLYGQKQAGRVWNQYLDDGLVARGFEQSKVDMCLYFHPKYNVNLLIYTDDGILTGDSDADIDAVIELLRLPAGSEGEHRAFDLTDEGTLNEYLGVKVEHLVDGSIKLSQPHLIQQIIDDIGFDDRTVAKPTPAASTVKLSRDLHGESMQEEWHYRSIIGKLNFLEKSTRPDIAYAVHQCARFSNDPKTSHASAVKRIVKYLIGTKDKGIYLRPDNHSFECWVDADFVGNWDRVNADVDPSTAKSRTGYVINYGGCPITWASKLQTEVALSTTEAEHNALSTSLREVIHLMQLIEEAKSKGWTTVDEAPKIHCKVFEDNIGALEMARLPKMRPRTKHLCIRLHHFREKVRKGEISIHHIATELQIADMLTKPQPFDLFVGQRSTLMKWPPSESSTSSKPNHLRACGIMAVDGRAKNQDKVQSQLSGTLRNSQHKNEDKVSMMSVDEMPMNSYTPPSKGTRRQRKRAGIMNYGNRQKTTEMEKMPRPEEHRKRVHGEVKQSQKRSKQS